MLSACLSGAVIAAPTSSLPEKIGGELNWDYRYCWLRDAAQTVSAFAGLGYLDEAYAYFSWMLHTTQLTRPRLQVLYDLYGRDKITEREHRDLEGYKKSAPVRFGNAAWKQKQLDIYGEVILSAFYLCQAGGFLEKGEQKTLRRFGDYICKHWQEADHGIWEERNEARQYTYSKIVCWAGLDKLQKMVEGGTMKGDAARYGNTKDNIAQAIHVRGYKPSRNAFTAAFDDARLDASLINIFQLEFVDSEKKAASTVKAIEEKLGHGDLFYRQESQPDEKPDEGAFLMLSFWAVKQKVIHGSAGKAKVQFERLLKFANDLGLYSEEIDPDTKELLGNFPQAYTHTALINAALAMHEVRVRREAA